MKLIIKKYTRMRLLGEWGLCVGQTILPNLLMYDELIYSDTLEADPLMVTGGNYIDLIMNSQGDPAFSLQGIAVRQSELNNPDLIIVIKMRIFMIFVRILQISYLSQLFAIQRH